MKRISSEKGQAMILLALGLVVFLGFVVLAIDFGVAYTDRRQAQNASDASSLAGAGAAALSLENSFVTYANWNCSDGRITAAKNAAMAAAISRATANSFTITGSASPGDNVVTAVCGTEMVNGFQDKYIDITTYVAKESSTSFLQLFTSEKPMNRVQTITRVRPRSPLVLGNAVVALNTAACQGQQNGLTIHGTADTDVNGGGMFSNGCMRANGNADAFVTGGGVSYAGEFSGNPSAYHPLPEHGSQLPPGSYHVPPPNCSDPAAHHINGNSLYGNLQPGLYCVTGDVRLNGNDSLYGDGVTIVLLDGLLTINGNADIQIAAPLRSPDPSPAVGGVLIYLGTNNDSDVQINGTSDSFFQGVVYAPSSYIDVLGNAGTNAYRSQIIGWDVELGGTADTSVVFNENLNYTIPSSIELYK